METEATYSGLILKPRNTEDILSENQAGPTKLLVKGSMAKVKDFATLWLWQTLEQLPIKQLTYDSPQQTRRFVFHFWCETSIEFFRLRHRWRGRTIVSGQKIHISLALLKTNGSIYEPKAQTCGHESQIEWSKLIGRGGIDDIKWAERWDDRYPLEMDLLDVARVADALEKLERTNMNRRNIDVHSKLGYLYHAASSRKCSRTSSLTIPYRSTSAGPCAEAIKNFMGIPIVANILNHEDPELQALSADCLTRIAKFCMFQTSPSMPGDVYNYAGSVEELEVNRSYLEALAKLLQNDDRTVQSRSFCCLACIITRKRKRNRGTVILTYLLRKHCKGTRW